MDFSNFVSGITGGLVVAVVKYFLDQWHSEAAKRRQERVEALLQVFRALDASDRKSPTAEIDDLEKAISTLQIFGSQYLVELAAKFRDELAENGTSMVGLRILNEVRNEIRREIGLPAISSDIKVFRYSQFQPKKN